MNYLKNQRIVMLLLILAGLSSSCTKLDLSPTDTIDPTKAFRNAEDVNMGILGVYNLIDNDLGELSSTVSDENMYPIENTVGNSDAFRWTYTGANGSVTSFYYQSYQAIDRANRVLAGMEKLNNTGEEALLNQYKGELFALRGYLHFELARAYASGYEAGQMGMAYMTVSEISYPAREDFMSYIGKVKADLQAAKPLVEPGLNKVTRINKTAVAAIQARVALYEKNWPDAITYSSEVINSLPLAAGAEFKDIWTDKSNKEVAWKLSRPVGTDLSSIGAFYFRQSGGYVLLAPSFKLINSFDVNNDIRFAAYIQHDPNRPGNKSKYLVNKFAGSAANPGLVDIKLFRTGEMYLIRAEAKAESQGDANADLNALGQARIAGYSPVNLTNKTDLLNAIALERFKELAFEGHRFFDLKRHKKNVERLDEDVVNASGAKTLTPAQAQYNLPLPNLEVQVNKNIKQNPNY